MSDLTRREWLKLAAGSAAYGASVGMLGCANGPFGPLDSPALAPALGPIDYRRAVATPTVCFGCTTHCGVIGWVQDGRVRKIEGNPLDPNTQGGICAKANGLISATEHPERIVYPLRRAGPRGSGRWERVSWDTALDDIASRLRALREAGTPEQLVFHYGRDKTKGFTKRFTDAFGTPHRLNRRSICSSNRRVPLMSFYGRDFEWESQDFANTRYIVNFGANPMEAHQGGLFTNKRIMDARVDHGAHMVTFEVRPSATASVSDEYFPIRPATDGAVAFAMANTIVREGLADRAFWDRWANVPFAEIEAHLAPYTPEWAEGLSGIPAADITRIARDFAAAAPACTTLSNRGSAKHYNGVQADRAIRLLDVLVGNVGRPGGLCLSSLRMWKSRYGQWGLPEITAPEPAPSRPAPWKPGTREFAALPEEVQERVAAFPEEWQDRYYGELATPSEYPLSWLFYSMRVGQLVYPYIREGRQKVGAYISFTLGAAFGYPEAHVARRVLLDESLIPFHVAIDIGYGEQAALADYILPDATALERWDAHSTNNYGLRPYTAIRQPLVEPAGEARPVQIILRDLARRIGGGMERHFDFEDLEDYYREWYSELPVSWEEFKRRGVWTDPERPLDYELYEREIPAEELVGTETDPETGIIRREKKGRSVVVGVERDGVARRGFPTPSGLIQVRDELFPQAARLTGLSPDDVNAQALPTWGPVPGHEGLEGDRFVLTTFKWNVHTQGRTADWKHQSEIVHDNPIWMNPDSAARLGIEDGEEVELTVYRPTHMSGSDVVGTFRQRVRLLRGVHERVVCVSHHMGHWERGAIARADAQRPSPARAGFAGRGATEEVWWSKARGGPGNGRHLNDALPINPTPLVGGQNWFDNVARIRKLDPA